MPNYPRIQAGMTTCNRIHLFYKTLSSLLKNCEDLDLIKKLTVVDVNSPEDEIHAMRGMLEDSNIPYELIAKTESYKGHPQSMRILTDGCKTKYYMHLEDDMSFIKRGHFIREAFDVMFEHPKCAQVVFKGEPEMFESKYLKSGAKFYEWTIENKDCYPGFSLNNGLWNMDVVKEVGGFEVRNDFEKDLAWRFKWAGYNSCRLGETYFQHDGWISAYVINGTPR